MKALDGFNTFIGIAVSLAPSILSLFGMHTSPNFQGDATEIGAAIVALIGGIYAVYGRIRATSPTWFTK